MRGIRTRLIFETLQITDKIYRKPALSNGPIVLSNRSNAYYNLQIRSTLSFLELLTTLHIVYIFTNHTSQGVQSYNMIEITYKIQFVIKIIIRPWLPIGFFLHIQSPYPQLLSISTHLLLTLSMAYNIIYAYLYICSAPCITVTKMTLQSRCPPGIILLFYLMLLWLMHTRFLF